MSKEDFSVAAGAAPILSKAQLLLHLAERCEREEASPDLDLCISVAINYRGVFLPVLEGEGYRWGSGEIELFNKAGKRIGCLDPAQFVPQWGTSLDAAVTLVPPEWQRRWKVGIEDDDGPVARLGYTIAITAKTPALAICAASLRALAHEAEPTTKDRAQSEREERAT